MAAWEGTHFPNAGRSRACSRAGLAAAIGFGLLSLLPSGPNAQQASPVVLDPGNAAVTGFSGALAPPQIAPGEDPAALTFIDPNGPSLRIVDLQRMGGSAAAQLVGAPKPFTFTAAQIGQVFGVALDRGSPPNIYVAASSAYGLPVVAPQVDGGILHVKSGVPNAAFMADLWGPKGGPGSIWKIDGATARVSLFADVTTSGRPNSGAALGGLAFDADSKSLFVADRETGLIHRFAMNGADLGSYDHGVTGRTAQGLAPAPWTSQQGLDVASAQFNSEDPSTWNIAAPERRIFGLAVHDRRLYYAVADSLQIWSVGLKPDGSFEDDAVIELAAPPAAGPTEISRITFDDQGRMLLAERPAPTGAFDFQALSVPAIGRVLRYAIVGEVGGRRVWQERPDEYAIGFPHDWRNSNGGVAIGYNYDNAGAILRGSCGGFLWATGEDLREASDPALAARLAQTGPLHVDGLQGEGIWQDRPRNEPPLASYFISYRDGLADDAARGHLGDIAIGRECAPASHAGLVPRPGFPAGLPPAGTGAPRLLPVRPWARLRLRPANRIRHSGPHRAAIRRRRRRARALPMRCAASATAPASRPVRDRTSRSAANAASSACLPPGAHVRTRAAHPGRRRSARATSAATTIRSIRALGALQLAAPGRLSTANASRRARPNARRVPPTALSAPAGTPQSGDPAASPAR